MILRVLQAGVLLSVVSAVYPYVTAGEDQSMRYEVDPANISGFLTALAGVQNTTESEYGDLDNGVNDLLSEADNQIHKDVGNANIFAIGTEADYLMSNERVAVKSLHYAMLLPALVAFIDFSSPEMHRFCSCSIGSYLGFVYGLSGTQIVLYYTGAVVSKHLPICIAVIIAVITGYGVYVRSTVPELSLLVSFASGIAIPYITNATWLAILIASFMLTYSNGRAMYVASSEGNSLFQGVLATSLLFAIYEVPRFNVYYNVCYGLPPLSNGNEYLLIFVVGCSLSIGINAYRVRNRKLEINNYERVHAYDV